MERRAFFGASGVAVAAATVLSQSRVASAQAMEGGYQVSEDIASNHGHAADLTMTQLIDLLRDTATNGQVELSIQGQSGHGHQISLAYLQLMTLLTNGSLELTSTTDFSHAHSITLNVAKAEPAAKE